MLITLTIILWFIPNIIKVCQIFCLFSTLFLCCFPTNYFVRLYSWVCSISIFLFFIFLYIFSVVFFIYIYFLLLSAWLFLLHVLCCLMRSASQMILLCLFVYSSSICWWLWIWKWMQFLCLFGNRYFWSLRKMFFVLFIDVIMSHGNEESGQEKKNTGW